MKWQGNGKKNLKMAIRMLNGDGQSGRLSGIRKDYI